MTPGDSAILDLVAPPPVERERLRRAEAPALPDDWGSHEIVVPSANRRQACRYQTVRPVVAIPVLPDGALDLATRYRGTVIDAASGGLGLQLEIPPDATPRFLSVGFTAPSGETQFVGVELRNVRPVTPTSSRLGTSYAGPANEILKKPVLAPQLDPQVMRYRYPIAPEVLASWVRAGILRPRLLDRVQVCPRCDTLVTYRGGCRACQSGRVERERLMHHFACAHVDRVAAFEHGGNLRCPKCRRQPLIVGADFDYQPGLAVCLDCGWKDSEAVQVAHCFRCAYRFPVEQAKHQDLIGYDVLRLDPLALLPAS
ncbi:MAG: hypothetical protein ACT4QC_20275 [Planctomycetaceae bacterium]